jgi:hypothetical protein
LTDSTIIAYRHALDRLRYLSRELATHFETSETHKEDGSQPQLVDIWANYEKTLKECQHAFQHVPASLRAKVPPPPSA